MRRPLFCLLTLSIFIGCSTPPKEKIPPLATMEKSSGKIVIYQLMTRLFGNKKTVNKPYGTRDENGVGKFNDIDDAALKSIKDMGITHVWYTGVLEHAVLTDYTPFSIPLDDADVVKGRAGSPYAIKDYYDVNPDLAMSVPNRREEFDRLLERTHQAGLKAIIDFVPNHVARHYHSDAKPTGVKDLGEGDDKAVAFRAANNFYYLPGQSFQVPKDYVALGANNTFPTKDGKFDETPAKATGNNVFSAAPGLHDWFETVKLNYGVDQQNQKHFDPIPDTWVKMKDILLYWTSKKVDGFRCDMAEMVPVEFWGWVIPQVRAANPDIIFIAEVYNPNEYHNYIENGKFNYLYDKVQLYDTLRLLVQGKATTPSIHAIQQHLSGINDNMLHFLENHDEQRVASPFFAGDMWKAAPAMVISATIDRGPVMIYFGQEVGEPGAGAAGFQANDGRTTIFDYWGVPEHQKWMNGGKFNGDSLSAEQKQLRQFYADVLSLAGRNIALTQGEYLDITAHNINAGNFTGNTSAFLRYSGTERLLVLNTFNATTQEIKVQLPASAVTALGLDTEGSYIARDLLWREAEVGFSKDFTFTLTCKPYSSYILKIK
ncbi:alpha-amylase family protein [Chryseolinea lacunae]|uniref:Alpha-amylase family protein n=1 Tax=Chryseolinea lacunae TaxID=2801331 RepID=A0ABS1KWS3_9BACT|nr:alpha-amylase family protein [Chryseolinea lacunae]MBL0743653.1 alpha-amylase family protein [Chryseolinea lacunae]